MKTYWFTSLYIPKCRGRRGKFWFVGRNAINEQLLFKDQIPVKTVWQKMVVFTHTQLAVVLPTETAGGNCQLKGFCNGGRGRTTLSLPHTLFPKGLTMPQSCSCRAPWSLPRPSGRPIAACPMTNTSRASGTSKHDALSEIAPQIQVVSS